MYYYIAFCQDRHIDPEVALFVDEEKAREWVKEWMSESVAHPSDLKESTGDGFEYYIQYGGEKDYGFVKKVFLTE